MARAKRKNTTTPAQTADADLFKLHDKFCKAYAAMLRLDTYDAKQGSGGSTATRKQEAAFRRWERAINVATDKARAVITAPAVTLEGMLMKIHVAGFNITDTKPGTFSAPYHGRMCKTGIQQWEPGKFAESDEIALIVSLRDDLNRFSGRRA